MKKIVCDGKAGCPCSKCQTWEAEAEREDYGYQQWLAQQGLRK
jgi:hypothetical protein